MDNLQNGPTMQSVLSPSDGYVPAAGLEAVEAMLKQGCDAKAVPYKPETKPQTAKADTPWGVKPGAMSNGKDFWSDLRKQVTALQQSGGTSQGG